MTGHKARQSKGREGEGTHACLMSEESEGIFCSGSLNMLFETETGTCQGI